MGIKLYQIIILSVFWWCNVLFLCCVIWLFRIKMWERERGSLLITAKKLSNNQFQKCWRRKGKPSTNIISSGWGLPSMMRNIKSQPHLIGIFRIMMIDSRVCRWFYKILYFPCIYISKNIYTIKMKWFVFWLDSTIEYFE